MEVTDAVMKGVVSVPHGWGHDEDGVRMAVASAHPGVNSNVLADDSVIDPVSGNAVLNGIPVEVAPPGGVRSAAASTRRSCRQVTLAVSDIRAMVEWAPQLGHSLRNSKRRRQ